MRKMFFSILIPLTLVFGVAGCDSGNGNGSTAPQALSSPARVSSVSSDVLVVSDYSDRKFCTVDKNSLGIIECFAAKGQPTGVVYVDYGGGRYFVGNQSVGSVDIFDRSGTFLGHLGGRTNLFGQVNDLTVDTLSELLYVLDSKAAVVKVYSFDGVDLGLDFGAGELVQPTAIALDPVSGDVYVSDFGSPTILDDSSVKIFNRNGDMIGSINGNNFFSAPQGMHIDTSGNLYLADTAIRQIVIFDSSHVFVKSVGNDGTDDGQLSYPLDVSVDESTGNIYVSDTKNGRITVFVSAGM